MGAIIVKTKIKELSEGLSVSSDFPDAFDEKVKEMLKQAVRRAESNGRRTIMPKDL